MSDLYQGMSDIHVEGEHLSEVLGRVDLNLLVAFDVLVRERSVTRAAQRVGVTQSAMSHTLRRLRELLEDPLLVRGRGGMELTPRAEALVVPVRSGLLMLGRALGAPAAFEPASARRSFRVACVDLFGALAVPPLLEALRRQAPGVDLAVLPLREGALAEDLQTGEVDLAVMPAEQLGGQGDLPQVGTAGLLRRTLFYDRFQCFLRADHPALVEGALTVESFAQAPHALVSPGGRGPGAVDHLLQERGLRRRVALRIPHFHAAPTCIQGSDLVLTAPSALRHLLPEESPLVMVEPPLALPQHGIALVWHQRFSEEPAHRWFRGLLTQVAGALLSPA